MTTENVVLPVLGLVTDPGPFTAAPPGSMAEAQNVVTLRPGTLEPRPGAQFVLDATLEAGGYTAEAMYADTSDVTTVWAKAGSTWIMRRSVSLTTTGPTSFTRGRIQIEPTGGRALFTSNHGVCTLPGQVASPASGSTSIAYRAGVPQPYTPRFGTQAAAAGMPAGSNWLAAGASVAYRVTLRRRLANGTIVESAPSGRAVVTNGGGAGIGVLMTDLLGSIYYAWHPNGAGAGGFNDLMPGDELCVYRSPSIVGTPSDEMRLRAVLPYDTTFNGYLNWFDGLADGAWSGEALYTNETQEGAQNANYRPEYARDIALYNGITFYAGYRSPQQVNLTLKKISTTPTDPSQAMCSFTGTGNITAGTNTILAATNIRYYSPGQVVTAGATDPGTVSAAFPTANTYVVSVNTSTNVVTLSANANATVVGQALSVWDWVEAQEGANPATRIYHNASLAVMTFASAQSLDWGWNGGGYGSDPIQLRASGASQTDDILVSFFQPDCTDPAFTVRSSKPYAWDRYVDYQTGVTSLQDGGPAELRWSKTNEPEHVPVPYRTVVGDASAPIRRVLSLRNSLLIFKDDGLYQAFGQVPDELVFELLDRTILIPAAPATSGDYEDPNSKWAIRFDDRAYVMSTRGPMAVTDSGGSLVGAPILETLRYNLGDLYGAARNNITAMAADYSARRAIWFANGYAYVMDVDSGQWVTWTYRGDLVSAACQRPLVSLSSALSPVPWSFARGSSIGVMWYRAPIATPGSSSGGGSDVVLLADSWPFETATVTVVSGSGPYTVTIAAGSQWTPTVGDILISSGSGTYCVVTGVTSATVFTTDKAPSLGAAAWYEAYESRCVWVGNAQDNIGSEKTVSRVKFPFSSALLLSRYVSPTESTGRLKTYFRGYRNPDPAVESFIDNDQSIGDAPYPIAAIYKVADVPMSLASDWALQAGFSVQQAGCWFSTSGIVYEYAVDGTGVERS